MQLLKHKLRSLAPFIFSFVGRRNHGVERGAGRLARRGLFLLVRLFLGLVVVVISGRVARRLLASLLLLARFDVALDRRRRRRHRDSDDDRRAGLGRARRRLWRCLVVVRVAIIIVITT